MRSSVRLSSQFSDTNSAILSGTENQSVSDDTGHQLRDRRRGLTPSESTRRASRQAYAEKYGLSSSNWNQKASIPVELHDSDAENPNADDSDSSDDAPLAERLTPPQRIPVTMQPSQSTMSTSSSKSRPMSVRNIAEATSSTRPSHFVKPATQQSQATPVPPDMQTVQLLFEIYNHKIYKEGYLVKKHELTAHGKASLAPTWTRVYVELCGPILTMWDANADDDTKNVLPHYINIADSYVDIQGEGLSEISLPDQTFSINSAGTNRYLFQASSVETRAEWVTAIRLSCFEFSRIHEIYTRRFVTRPLFADIVRKTSRKTEGWVQARLPGTTEWHKYWAVVTDRREEKRFFGKKSVPSRGQLMFFESKKSKVATATIVNVAHAYTVYPESPRLVDMATIMKIEGNVFKNQTGGDLQLVRAAATVLVMASSTKELVRWLIGTFDAFKLYGRPSRLLDDPNNIDALNFAESRYGTNNPRLFLELTDVRQVDVSTETLIESKNAFAEALKQRIKPIMEQQVYSSMGKRTNSMPLLSGISGHQVPDARRRTLSSTNVLQSMPNNVPPPNTRSSLYLSSNANRPRATTMSNIPPHSNLKTIYASDESDSEEDTDDTDNSESDGNSLFSGKQEQSLKNTAPSHTAKMSPAGNQHMKPAAEPVVEPAVEPAVEPMTIVTPKNNTVLSDETKDQVIVMPELQQPAGFTSTAFTDIQVKAEQPITPIPVSSAPSSSLSATSSLSTPSSPHAQKSVSGTNQILPSLSSHTSDGSHHAMSETQPMYTASAAQRVSTATLNKPQPPAYAAWSGALSNHARPSSITSTSDGSQSSAANRPTSDSGSSYAQPQHPPQRPPMDHRRSGAFESEYRRPSSTLMQQQWGGDYADDMYRTNDNYGNDAYGHEAYSNDPYGNDPYGQNQMEYQDGEYDPGLVDYVEGEARAIPQLGEQFATRNSLLDLYRPDHLPARVQEEHARLTGQPLIQIPNKPPQRRSGLVGKISEIEQEKRELSRAKIFEMEKEREKRRSQILSNLQANIQSPTPQHSQPAPSVSMTQPTSPIQPMTSPYGMMNTSMMDPRMSMMQPMMDPRMSMMSTMQNMQPMQPMQGMPMMQPVMDPRMMPNMAMMYMMQPTFGAYPMFQQQQMQLHLQQQAAMWNSYMMHGDNKYQQEDEGDNTPLGSPQPVPSASTSYTSRPKSSISGYRHHQRQRSGHI